VGNPEWLVFYGDGSTLSNLDIDPQDVPWDDVQAVIQFREDVGWFSLTKDFYWYEHNQWFGGDQFGMFDYLTRPGWRKVVFGRYIPDQQFKKIMQSMDEKMLQLKSAYLKGERRYG